MILKVSVTVVVDCETKAIDRFDINVDFCTFTCGGEAAKISSADPPNMPSSSSSASKSDWILEELLAFSG